MHDFLERSNGHLKLSLSNDYDKTLVVVFGALNCLNKIYFLERQMNFLKKNVLYVNSERNDWFIEPQSYLSDESVQKSAEILNHYINNLIVECGFTSVVLFGHSLGAYGLLTYSQYMEFAIPNTIIVSNPKVDLTFSYLKVVKDNYVIDQRNRYKNLYNLAISLGKIKIDNRKYILIYGELDLSDVYSALYFKDMFDKHPEINFELVSIKDSGHYLFQSMKEIGLDNSLDCILSGKASEIVTVGKLHQRLNLSDIDRLMKIQKDLSLDSDYISMLLNIINTKYSCFFYALNRIGVAYIQAKRYKEALSYLQQAFKVSPSDVNNNTHLASCYYKLSYYTSALVHYSLCFRYSKSEEKKNKALNFIKIISSTKVND